MNNRENFSSKPFNHPLLQKVIVQGFAIIFLAVPVITAADSLVPIQPTVEQLLARVAALVAQRDGKSVGCAIATSKSAVRVSEPFRLWWGSYGATASVDPNIPTPSPASDTVIIASKRGVYEYKLTFYGPDGATNTCRTTVSVS